MRDFSFLRTAFITVVILGVLHFVAGAFYLYWMLDWFDYLMHFLGGLGGGLVVIWFISEQDFSPFQIMLIVLCAVIFVGVAWELFENVNGITQSTEGYRLDVFSDLLMDTFGAIIAGFAGIKKLNK